MTLLAKFFDGFGEGTKQFGKNITLVINTTLLFIVYVFGVGLTSMTAKLVGKKFLDINIGKKKTYWSDLSLKKKKIKSYYKQF